MPAFPATPPVPPDGPRRSTSWPSASKHTATASSVRLLRSPWPSLSAGCIEGDRSTDERLERADGDLLPLMDVDCAPCVPLEARVEKLGRVLQRSPFGERELHDGLVRLAGADDPVVRPRGSARVRRLHPLHLLDDVRVCLLDELAHPPHGLPAPVPELGDPLVDPFRCRPALSRTRTLHAVLLNIRLGSNSHAAMLVIGSRLSPTVTTR